MTSAGRWLPGGETVEISEWSFAHCSQLSNLLALPDPSSFSTREYRGQAGAKEGHSPTMPPIFQAQSIPARWGCYHSQREEMQNSQPPLP